MKGKILRVCEGSLDIIRGNCLCSLRLSDNYLESVIPVKGWKYDWASQCRFTRRLLRAEITGLYTMSDGGEIAVAKGTLLHRNKGADKFIRCFDVPRGSKPLNLCVLPNGHVFFGEYFQNMEKQAVNIFGSVDFGRSWRTVYTFPKGSINHIHGLFYDPYTEWMWFLTGDREEECMIGYTEDEFSTIQILFRGGQEYRSCQLFFYPNFVVYATDSQYVQNEIKCFDRRSLEITSLTNIHGSAIKGGQQGFLSYLSTTIEPSKVNKNKDSHVWFTRDGLHWHDIFQARKDSWPSIMQFGTFEFPQYTSPIQKNLYFSGRALKGYDGQTICLDISNL